MIEPHPSPAYVQLPAWPSPHQLCLPEQLSLPLARLDDLAYGERSPRGVEPVAPPDAPAALGCVEEVIAGACRTFGIPLPTVRWFKPLATPDAAGAHEVLNGFVEHGALDVWLNVAYASPQRLAVTAAHEATHYWQSYRRGPCSDGVEHTEREGEAQRRAALLVPKGTYRTPRGKKRDQWFEPARRRYG